MKILLIILFIIGLLKLVSLFMIFILKLRFLRKDEADQMSFLKKVTFLEWGTEYDEWYIIPTITIDFNGGIDIDFNWLKIHYSHFWKVVTIGEEEDYAEFIRNKNKNK